MRVELMALRADPTKQQQLELFTAMFTDIAVRDSRDAMELPFLSLSKNPRFEPILHKTKDVEVTVTGGAPYGIANIWDWDLMMWLISQIRQAIDSGVSASRRVRFHRHAFLQDVRRSQGGAQYRRLEESIARLKNTNIVTTVRAKGRRTVMFSWIEYAELERDERGHVCSAVVVLPEWLYEAVANETLILSLHRDYFLLTGAFERWLYRLIRKGAGRSPAGWQWRLRWLHERCGSSQEFKYFARDLRRIAGRGRLLDYQIECFEDSGETFIRARRAAPTAQRGSAPRPRDPAGMYLSAATFERARELAPGYDIYALEADWRAACARTNASVQNPDAAYLAWCRKISNAHPLRR